jgi:TRAP-type C4-dicarboxylate transport system substrate-binding protein
MKTLTSIAALFIFCVTLVFLVFPSMTLQSVDAAEFELSSASLWPAVHSNYKSLTDEWGGEIAKRTNNRVKVIGYPVGTLLKANQIYEGLLNGIVDIGVGCFAYTPGRFPFIEAIDLPLGYGSGEVATKVANDIYKKYEPKELSDTHVCFLHAHGPGLISTKKPVMKLEDLAGMKIRCTGLAAKIVQKLGAIPVAMPQNAAYEALQKGVVDGTACPIEVLEKWKQGELINYLILNYSSAYTTAFYTVMNLEKWNSLPEDIQKVITDVSEEWIERQGKLWDSSDRNSVGWLKEKGVEIVEQSPQESARWRKAVVPVIDEYIQEKGAKGLPAAEAIADINMLIKKYSE